MKGDRRRKRKGEEEEEEENGSEPEGEEGVAVCEENAQETESHGNEGKGN